MNGLDRDVCLTYATKSERFIYFNSAHLHNQLKRCCCSLGFVNYFQAKNVYLKINKLNYSLLDRKARYITFKWRGTFKQLSFYLFGPEVGKGIDIELLLLNCCYQASVYVRVESVDFE